MKIQVRIVRIGDATVQAQASIAGWEVVARGPTEAAAIGNLQRRIAKERSIRERIVEIEVPDPKAKCGRSGCDGEARFDGLCVVHQPVRRDGGAGDGGRDA